MRGEHPHKSPSEAIPPVQFAARIADIPWAGQPGPTSWLSQVAPFREASRRTMHIRYAALPTLEALRGHILQTLCGHDHLDPQQTPLRQGLITRSGKACGLLFQVQGPRLLKTYAIWAGEEDRILFYDSSGMRFAETRLSEGPDPLQMAA